MDHQEVADIIHTILDENDLDDKVARRLLLALTLDTRGRAVDHYQQTNKELVQLREIVETQTRTIETLANAWADHQQYHKDNPPLLWLLRFRTKETIATILFLLSAWYVSGIRQPILKWLGLPIF